MRSREPRSYPCRFAGYEGMETQLPSQFLLGLLRSMLRIRLIELEIERRYSEDEMKTPVHLAIGQEATVVGLCAALRIEDRLYTSHRSHGPYLAKGGDLKAMMSELYCKANGCAGSKGGSMHLVDKKAGLAGCSAIVGGIIPIAAGSALASSIRKDGLVSVAIFGDAATEEGVCSETLNFAALKKLPLVFFCENNFYSVCTPLHERKPEIEIHERAAAFGMPSACVDGTNVLAVYETLQAAVERARRGEGPSFIEAQVYRWRAHAGAGDDSAGGYRTVEEREKWEKERCPIEQFFQFLSARGAVDREALGRMGEEIQREVREAFAHARSSPLPGPEELTRNVYGLG